MAKKVIEVEVQTNIPGTINELKQLKKELKNAAAGSEDFKRLYNEIDDLEEKISSTKKTSADWVDSIAAAPGPLGMLGKAINSVKEGTVSFGGALKATGIGLIVALLGGLYKAFSDNDTALKKIQPLLDGLEKAFQGVFRALEPVFNALVDMAVEALPVVTKGIGLFYSAVVGLFTFVKEAGGGYINMWKGILTLDFDKAKEGVNQMKDSFASAVKAGEEAYKRFEEGSKENTRKEAEEAKKKREEEERKAGEAEKQKRTLERAAAKKAKEDRIAHGLEMAAVEQKLLDEIAGIVAKSELDKLELQKKNELRDLHAKIKKGDDELALQKLINEKYAKLEEELYVKTLNENEKNEKLRLKLLDQNYGVILGYKESKNAEEIDKNAEHNRLLLEQQMIEDQKAVELINIANGTLENIDNDKAIIKAAYVQKELESAKAATDAKIALAKEEADRIKAVDDAAAAAKRKALDTGLEILSTFLGKNKAVALAILALQKGLAIADVVVNAGKAIAVATSNMALVPAILPPGIPNPAYIPAQTLGTKSILTTKISAATSIASILAAGITSAQSITAGSPESGGPSAGGGTTTVTPPNYNVVGASPTNLLTAQAMAANNNQTPIKAYVVAGDVSTAQSLNRNIITSASIG